MMICRKSYLLWACCVIATGPVAGQSPPNDRNAEAASLFEAFISNMLAWETGDFLIKTSHSFDAFDGRDKPGWVVNNTTFLRFIFDHTEKRYLCVSKKEIWGIVEGVSDARLQKGLEQIGVSVQAFMISDGRTFTRFLPKAKDRVPKASKEEIFRYFRVPEIRLSVLVPFTHGYVFEDRVNVIRQVSMNKISKVGSDTDGRRKVTIGITNPQHEVTNESRYVFDTINLVPLKKTIYFVRDGKPDIESTSISAQWKELGGLFVPVELRKQAKERVSVGGKVKTAVHYTDFRIHWFSLNEKLEPKYFDKRILDDQRALADFVDPEISNATDLLQRTETYKSKQNSGK